MWKRGKPWKTRKGGSISSFEPLSIIYFYSSLKTQSNPSVDHSPTESWQVLHASRKSIALLPWSRCNPTQLPYLSGITEEPVASFDLFPWWRVSSARPKGRTTSVRALLGVLSRRVTIDLIFVQKEKCRITWQENLFQLELRSSSQSQHPKQCQHRDKCHHDEN